MNPTAAQRDALVELGNIGISRAAVQLSSLLGEEILVEVPQAEILSAHDIHIRLCREKGDVACVYQELRDGMNGRVALLLTGEASHSLLLALLGGTGLASPAPLTVYEQEALLEIGNILISSCVSVIADLLHLHIGVGIPRLANASVEEMLEDGSTAGDEQQGLLLHAQLRSSHSDIGGEVMLVLSAAAVRQVLARLPTHSLEEMTHE